MKFETVQEAKTYLRANFEKGATCPCCGQLVKLWKHALNSSIVRTLIAMHVRHLSGQEYIHIMKEVKLTTMYGIAEYWKLIEAKEHDIADDNNKASGLWKLTPKGTEFVEMRILVPKYVYVFNDKVDGFSKEETNIEACLAKGFVYRDLIKGL
jgi:predicted transcriptional regulator